MNLFKTDRVKLEGLGRAAASAMRVHQYLQSNPFISAPKVSQALGLSKPTVSKCIGHLEALGIVHEITNRQRGRLFAYSDYMDILNQGTEPL